MGLRRATLFLARFGVAGAAFGLVTGYLGFIHPLFDTASNFRLHLFWGLLFVTPIMLLLKFKREALFSCVIAVLCLWGVRTAIPTQASALSGPSHTLISYNMKYENPQREEVISWLIQEDSDFLYLTEYSRFWKPIWQPLLDHYPYHVHCPEWEGRAGNFIFSKYPLDLKDAYCQIYSALQVVETEINGTKMTIGGAHFRWPWPASGPEQITTALPALTRLGENALIVGDFNSVPWSYSMQRIAEAGDLNIYRGIGPSWIFKPFPDGFRKIFGLPIDNAMQKGALQIVSTQRLPSMGSDHMPIKFEFSIGR